MVTKIETVALSPPPEFLICSPAPAIPNEITGQNAGEYLLRLDSAYQDCAGMLERVRAWVEAAEAGEE